MNSNYIKEIINFTDSHPQLVTLFIFLSGLTVAWFSGALKSLKGLSHKLDSMLRIKINPCSAHVTFLKEFEHDKKQAKRFAI